MPYEQILFSEAKLRVASALGDSGMVFFSEEEVGRALLESLRTWNSMAQYWRARGSFATISGDDFIDLGPNVYTGSELLVERTLQDDQVIPSICDALMESQPVAGVWTGTDKFTMQDVLDAMEDAANEFLFRTSCIIHDVEQDETIAPPAGRLILDDERISDIRRFDWFSLSDDAYHHLWRGDEWSLNAVHRLWSTDAQEPDTYAITSVPPLTVQLAPVPLNGGTASMLVVRNVLPPTGLGELLSVPNDFAWAIKWGALAKLLNHDGQVRDPERAQYCQQRFEEAIAVAAGAASIVQAEINGVPVQVESVFDLDSTRPGWRNESGQPEQLGLCGLNMLALAPAADGVYSITVDVVKNAPQPADTDYLDLGKECLDYVLNYAQHILSFKMGGAEFASTGRYLEDLYKGAMRYNAKLRANGAFYDITQARSQRETAERPAMQELLNA